MQRTAYRAKPLLNGILALGFLLVLASVAGLAATVVSRSCGEGWAERKPDDGSGGGDGSGLHPQMMEGKFGYRFFRAELSFGRGASRGRMKNRYSDHADTVSGPFAVFRTPPCGRPLGRVPGAHALRPAEGDGQDPPCG
jgi:hypothetical protein